MRDECGIEFAWWCARSEQIGPHQAVLVRAVGNLRRFYWRHVRIIGQDCHHVLCFERGPDASAYRLRAARAHHTAGDQEAGLDGLYRTALAGIFNALTSSPRNGKTPCECVHTVIWPSLNSATAADGPIEPCDM